jgi:DNA-binding transcriptional ArsR family regulator
VVAATKGSANVRRPTKASQPSHWTFLTNHATILLHVASHPDDTMRSIATTLGLTERTTAAAIADLRDAGYISVRRQGRHNHYAVNRRLPLRRAAHAQVHVCDLVDHLTLLLAGGRRGAQHSGQRSSRKRTASA